MNRVVAIVQHLSTFRYVLEPRIVNKRALKSLTNTDDSFGIKFQLSLYVAACVVVLLSIFMT